MEDCELTSCYQCSLSSFYNKHLTKAFVDVDDGLGQGAL